jgi:hypothetical protein
MKYPEYRRRGWPIGSGETEAAVKQYNKRIKGTEQFWSTGGVEAILGLRGMCLSQDQRWDKYWANRSVHVNYPGASRVVHPKPALPAFVDVQDA